MPAVAGAEPSGGGTWQPGWLEIHHIDAGQASSTLIVGPTGRSMLVDAGEADWEADDGALIVGPYIKNVLGSSHLDTVLVSHFHLDHTGYPGHGGLWHLFNLQGFTVGKFLHRDFSRYLGENGGTLARWRGYLAGEGGTALHPEIAKLGDGQIDLGPGVMAMDGFQPKDWPAIRPRPAKTTTRWPSSCASACSTTFPAAIFRARPWYLISATPTTTSNMSRLHWPRTLTSIG
jgi:hypothetical protein